MSRKSDTQFQVAGWVDRLGGNIERHRRLWLRIADIETAVLRSRLDATPVRRPIYVCGLARSGTTIVLEALARHADVATHQYRDYPPVLTPYLWRWLLKFIETVPSEPVERAHGDRILITPHSPEAMEEVLWMSFFPDAHDPAKSAVLDGSTSNPAFEAFYAEHVAKLLLAQGRTRYAAKGNYNLTRIGYIRHIFPDARFVIPVRHPRTHIESLIRQHRNFTAGVGGNERALAHLRRVGHFEFGPDRRPINAGCSDVVSEIVELWQAGEEVRGWARYWAHIHDHVLGRIAADPAVAEAVLLLRYEDLCAAPEAMLRRLFAHVGLDDAEPVIESFAGRLAAPDYYVSRLTGDERRMIREETEETAQRLGYGLPRAVPVRASLVARG